MNNEPMVGDPLLAGLRRAILDGLPSADANVEWVARRMGVTSRTLQRRLQDRGTTFLDELERERKGAARIHVGSMQTAIADVAVLLGFSAVASFSRAFRRWFGCSPSQFRRADIACKAVGSTCRTLSVDAKCVTEPIYPPVPGCTTEPSASLDNPCETACKAVVGTRARNCVGHCEEIILVP